LIQATVRSSSGHQVSATRPRDGLAAHQASHRKQPAMRRMKSLSFRCRQVPDSFPVQIFKYFRLEDEATQRNNYNLIFFCRWPALCASVVHPPACRRRRRHHLSSVWHGVVNFFLTDLHLIAASTDYCYDIANSLYRSRLTC
jgi:hypothetical protein